MTNGTADLLTTGVADTGGHIHLFPIRVYYEDTDAEGIVYHANYLKFAERARTEMLRLSGREQFRMMAEEGIGFAVSQCNVDYYRPAHLDDILEVRTAVADVAGASLRLRQEIYRSEELLTRLNLRLAVMNRQGRPVRIPEDIRDSLSPHVIEMDPPAAG
jgi:acyl-CoA thioester hydrolase